MRLGTQESTHRVALARLVATALMLATACGGDGPTGAAGSGVTRVELTIPDSTMLVGDSLVATAVGLDSSGTPVPDASVRWSSSDGSIVLVSSSGVARARALGIVRIRATIGGVFAERQVCVRREAAAGIVEAGDGQTATILTDAPVLPVARFVDAAGLPVACLAVEILSSPFADIAPRAATTDADGRVRITKWRLAAKAGTQYVGFRAANRVTATVMMTARPGPPAKLTGPADVTVPGYMGQTLGRFYVGVTDVGDNPLVGVPMSFAAVGAKPSLSAAGGTTNDGGAVGVDIRLDTVGTATITATVAGVSPFTFRVSATGFRAKSIVMGGHRGCASDDEVTWRCWGYERDRPAPLGVVTRLTIGRAHLCGVNGVMTIPTCWGGNEFGELGVGSTWPPPPGYTVDTIGSPQRPGGALGNSSNFRGVYGIFAGFGNTCALANQQQLWCWGSNANGVIGDPAVTPGATFPVRVGSPGQFQTLHMGRTTVCGLDLAGQLYCWGRNANGELGDGTTTDRWSPTFTSGFRFASLSGGCALTSDGTAFCWGDNASGHVGDGTTLDRLVPTAVAGGLRFKSISTGNRINCGIAVTDRLYCWGDGQLAPREVPLPNGKPAVAVATAEASVCVIASSDEVFCWGENDQHALGDGTTIDRSVPVPVLPALVP